MTFGVETSISVIPDVSLTTKSASAVKAAEPIANLYQLPLWYYQQHLIYQFFGELRLEVLTFQQYRQRYQISSSMHPPLINSCLIAYLLQQ